MIKKLKSVAGILCISLALVACGNNNQSNFPSNGETPAKTATQYKLDMLRPSAYSSVKGLSLEPGSSISIIGRYADDSYWKEVENGANQAVEDLNELLGYKGTDKIKLTYSAPEVRDDINEQVNLLDEELDRLPAAIAIATIDATACSIQFDSASENNIPIVTFDSGNDYQHIAAHVSTDNSDAAKTAAAKLAHAINKQGEVAVFVQDSVSTTSETRLQSFLKTIATDYPDISVVHVYRMDQLTSEAKTIAEKINASLAEGQAPLDPQNISQEDVVKYILEQYPNLKGIYTTNLDTTQLVANVLSDLEKEDLKFIGFDGGKEQMELLKDGVLEGLIIQNPYGMGYATVVAAVRVALGLGNESFVNTGYSWVTKDNMDTDSIKNMLY